MSVDHARINNTMGKFAKTLWDELEIMKKYEPQCYKLCVNVFGESYILRKEFELFRMV